MEMPNIAYKGNIQKSVSAKDNYYKEISYLKTIDDFIDDTMYSKYISSIERLVRTNDDYKAFLSYIKNVLGINFCQVFNKIYSDIDATVEFHHGPLFTLYDICELELTKFIKTGQSINTFRIADSVLDLHFQLKVNGVMMCKTVHEMAHNEDIFINLNQSIGDINAYIQEYAKYFTPEIKYKIWTFIQMSKENDSFDLGGLNVDVVKSYISAA